MKRLFGFIFAVLLTVSIAYVPLAFADAKAGEAIFKAKAKKCKTCHKAQGDPNKFKPVGPGLKGVGKRYKREWLKKWLSPENKGIWEGNGAAIQDIKARYKAAKKGKEMKKSQMVKNFGSGKGGKKPKITLTDKERKDIIDYLMTL